MESERLDFKEERDLGISGIEDKELYKSIFYAGYDKSYRVKCRLQILGPENGQFVAEFLFSAK